MLPPRYLPRGAIHARRSRRNSRRPARTCSVGPRRRAEALRAQRLKADASRQDRREASATGEEPCQAEPSQAKIARPKLASSARWPVAGTTEDPAPCWAPEAAQACAFAPVQGSTHNFSFQQTESGLFPSFSPHLQLCVFWSGDDMVLGKVRALGVYFDTLNENNLPVFSGGDLVSGRVVVDVTGDVRVKSLDIVARGVAKVRWTESRNGGAHTAYTQNYTEEVEYLHHYDTLIGEERGECSVSAPISVLSQCALRLRSLQNFEIQTRGAYWERTTIYPLLSCFFCFICTTALPEPRRNAQSGSSGADATADSWCSTSRARPLTSALPDQTGSCVPLDDEFWVQSTRTYSASDTSFHTFGLSFIYIYIFFFIAGTILV